jgi:hypothetical protein
MPQTRHCAILQRSIIQGRTGMWTHIFQGIKPSIHPENSDKLVAHAKLTPLALRNIVYFGQTDGA